MSQATGRLSPPVAIGGVGGSGTRLVADIVRRLGYYIGDDLNAASDNLWFTLLFKRTELLAGGNAREEFDRAATVFRSAMIGDAALTAEQHAWVAALAETDRPQHESAWLRQRAKSLTNAAQRRPRLTGPWGWKEPNTHIFLDRLSPAFTGLRYIHVMRNGLDMAHAANQNQLRLWGPVLVPEGDDRDPLSPRASLRFWCVVNRRAIALGQEMAGRFLLLNYDAFCAGPINGLRTLAAFLGTTLAPAAEPSLVSLVRPSGSIGRFRAQGLEIFDAGDIAFVKSLGFDTECP